MPKLPKRTARLIEDKLQAAYKAGYDSGRQHGYELGFKEANKRAEAIVGVARVITHLA